MARRRHLVKAGSSAAHVAWRAQRLAVFYIAFATGLFLSAFGAAALPGQAPAFICGSGRYQPAVKRELTVDQKILSWVLLPFLNGVFDDPLQGLAAGPLRFRVIDLAGKPVADAAVAAIYTYRSRFAGLAEGNGKAIILPFGDYAFNAVLPGSPLRWGSTLMTFGKESGSSVTITLSESSAVGTQGQSSLKAIAGADVTAEWTGARPPGATLFVLDPSIQSLESLKAEYPVGAASGPMTLQAPYKPGRYQVVLALCAPEIRLASWTLDVSALTLKMEAQSSVMAGQDMIVKVPGSERDKEELRILKLDGQELDDSRSGDRGQDGAFTIRAPMQPGHYLLDYGVANTSLARATLNVTAAAYSISAPAVAAQGARIPLVITGANLGDVQVTIWSATSPRLKIAEDMPPGSVRIYGKNGPYDILLTDKGRRTSRVLARTRITVNAPPAVIVAPGVVRKGKAFNVRLPGPLLFGDIVSIVKRANPDPRFSLVAAPDEDGDTVIMRAPDKTGDYDLVFAVTDRSLPAQYRIIERVYLRSE